MQVKDLFSNGKRWHLRHHEKGGKCHEMPVLRYCGTAAGA
jgi:hypothetical protein